MLIPASAYGWKAHPLLTRLLLKAHKVKFKSHTVESPSFPAYLKDINRFNTKICRNTFTGKITAPDVLLIKHSIDPDCGLDTNINRGFLQKFMGGSQGYRHLYYPMWTLKFPLLFLPQGIAPFRADKFFELAKARFKNGNIGEALLFIAWALHYIEDLSQPYHTCQTSWDFIKGAFTLSAMIRYTKNFHRAYEDAIYLLMIEELNGTRNYELLEALKHPVKVDGEDVEALAINIAKMSSQLCKDLFRASYLLWGKKLKVKKPIRLKPAEILDLEGKEEFNEMVRLTKKAFRILSGGFLRYIHLASEISGKYIYTSD